MTHSGVANTRRPGKNRHGGVDGCDGGSLYISLISLYENKDFYPAHKQINLHYV